MMTESEFSVPISPHEAIPGARAGEPTAVTRLPDLVIRPTKGWGSLGLRDIWEFRELLYLLTWREVKGRYRQMAFGPLWMIMAPLIQMVIFSLLFGVLFQLPSDGVPYPIFTYVALLPWMLFANSARNAAGSLVSQQQLIAKVYFPRLIIPLSQAISALVDFAFSFVILLGMMLVYRIVPSWQMLALPAYLLLALVTALAVGLWLATISVKFRDVLIVLGFVISAWQYATPVAYSASLVPAQWLWLYNLNPMTVVVEGFRWALLGTGRAPIPTDLLVAGVMVLLMITGAYYFRRTERTIVDTL
jgi:lipopolysaccharide transport system permease protein